MREAINGGPQTRRTNSVAVVGLIQSHLHDWIVLFGLLVLDRALAIIHPFKRFIGEYMLDDICYPHKANTVPFWAVLVIAVFIPIFFTVLMYLKQRDVRDLHHAILAAITDAVKDGVGRPRPDFFWRCFPDGHAIFKNVTGEVVCHGDPKAIQEGHKSFPSGHTSCTYPSTIFEISNNADALTLAQNQQGYHSPLPVNSTISDVEMERSVESQHTGD